MINTFLHFPLHASGESSYSAHGPTMQTPGIWDYVIVAIAIVVLVLSLCLSIKYLIHPGEKEGNHIKKKILDDDIPDEKPKIHER
jgi:hypothetical protein